MPKEKKQLTANDFISGILHNDRVLLSRAITLIESKKSDHQALASEIVDKCIPHSGSSLRIGVTGSPGVGKSTFIEAFGMYLINEQKKKIAVLAIDPSSQKSKGSILGDKTRMEELSSNSNAFIRPSPAGDSLGGVASKTRETMILCEAAGFDTIMIETVGVGQSEIAVHGMVDFFLLLLLPGAGDDLQGIKRGIMEMADLVAINKSDGDRIQLANSAKKDYARALHLFPPKESGWTPSTATCSALKRTGLEEIWKQISDFHMLAKSNNWFRENRKEQLKNWFNSLITDGLKALFYGDQAIVSLMQGFEKKVVNGEISATKAVAELLDLFRNKPL